MGGPSLRVLQGWVLSIQRILPSARDPSGILFGKEEQADTIIPETIAGRDPYGPVACILRRSFP